MLAAMVCYRSEYRFDLDYYLKHHVPMSEELLVPLGVIRSEVRRFGPNPDGSVPTYQVMSTLYFESMESLQAFATSPHLARLAADVPNFSSGPPEQFISEVVYSAKYEQQGEP